MPIIGTMSGFYELDSHTLYIVIASAGVALAIIFLSIRSVAPRYDGLTRWALSDALIGSGFLLFAFYGWSDLLGGVIANTLILAGASFLSNGVWSFLGRPRRFEPLAYLPPAAAAPLFAYFTFAAPLPGIRVLIITSLLSLQFGASAAIIFYRFPYSRKEPAYYTAAVFAILSAWFSYASFASFGKQWVYPFSLFLLAVGMVAWTLGMGIMTAMRLAEELARHEQQAGKLRQATLVKTIIDTIPQAIILKDRQSRFVTCNAAFARSIGRTPESIAGLGDRDIYPAEYADKYISDDAEIMASGETREFVERYLENGQELWIETIKTPVHDHDGRTEGILVSFRNITQRKLDEFRLQESEKKYRELSEQLESRVAERTRELERAKRESDLFFDVSLEYLCVTDFKGRFLKMSPSWSKNLGWKESELMNRPLIDFIHREDRKTTFEATRELAAGGRIQDKANRFMRVDGSWVWLSWSAVGVPEQGVVVAAAHDITSRVETEERLRAAREVAEAASRAKSQFISTMSHELRTPLNAVLGYAGLLAPQIRGEQGERYIKSIESSGRALLAIINDLLDLTKVESGRLELTPAPFDPRRMMDEIAEIFRFGAEEKALCLEFKASSNLPRTLLLDAPRLRQVLINLIGNSIKFTERGSVRLRLDASPAESSDADDARAMYLTKLVVEVEDSGIGMTEQYRARLFEPFSQQDAGISRKYGGTGLGLAIAKRLLDLMGGTISCESELGKGTRFRIEIPNVRAAGNALEVVSFIGGDRRVPIAEPEARGGRALGKVIVVAANEDGERRFRSALAAWGPDTRIAGSEEDLREAAADLIVVEEDAELARELKDGNGSAMVALLADGTPNGEGIETIRPGISDADLADRIRALLELKATRDALERKNAEAADVKRSMEKKNAELEALVAKLNRLSMTDELTGLSNRRAVSARLAEEVARAKRAGKAVSVLMGDLDRFKLVNDRLGHEAGDVVLAESARRFSLALRESDSLGRWGGEEFLAVLPETDLEAAAGAAERARERIGDTPIAYGTELIRATMSIGAATAEPSPSDNAERWASALIRAADDALYRAKAKGRNRVESIAAVIPTAPPTPPSASS